MARPVKNYTHPVNVSIYLDINYIKNLVIILITENLFSMINSLSFIIWQDIQTNMLETEGWLRLSW